MTNRNGRPTPWEELAELPGACWAFLEALDLVGPGWPIGMRGGDQVAVSDLIRDGVYSEDAQCVCECRRLIQAEFHERELFLRLTGYGVEALAWHRLQSQDAAVVSVEREPEAADHRDHGQAGSAVEAPRAGGPVAAPANRNPSPAGGAENDTRTPQIVDSPEEGTFRALAKWAAKKLRRNQRRAVELLAEIGGSLRIADIASDATIGWEAPYDDSVSSLIRELNKENKLPAIGWRVHRHDNEIRLARLEGKMT